MERHVYQNSKGGKQYVPLEQDGRVLSTATPRLAKTVGHKLAMLPGDKVVDDLKANHALSMSKRLVQCIAERLGEVLREREGEWEYDLPEREKDVAVVSLGRDGTCTALVGEGWRQTMVGTLSLYDKEGERLHTIYLGCAPEPEKPTFDALLDREIRLLKKQLGQNVTYSGVADGAVDNWTFLESRTEIQVLDFFHASEYLSLYASKTIRQKLKREAWVENAKATLKEKAGGAAQLLEEMRKGYQRASKSAQEDIHRCITYFENNLHRMDYPAYIEAKIPIGSGVTEAACKTFVKGRLAGSGMRWKRYGIDNMLMTRGLIFSAGRWNQFWKKIERYGYY
jgi:hypothetical protein